MKKKLVILTGAGISEESGVPVFRGDGGLWEGYDPREVCSIEGWNRNPALVQRFYNERRAKLGTVEPNEAHLICKRLEEIFDVEIITTNVDDLHERAGSERVLHLHGELTKSCNSDGSDVKEIGYDPLSEVNTERRPFIVFFGEEVPLLQRAAQIIKECDFLIVVGTSLSVYPAATLLFDFAGEEMVYIDPNGTRNISPEDRSLLERMFQFRIIEEKASIGLQKLDLIKRLALPPTRKPLPQKTVCEDLPSIRVK